MEIQLSCEKTKYAVQISVLKVKLILNLRNDCKPGPNIDIAFCFFHDKRRSIGPRQVETCLRAYAVREGPDQPAAAQSDLDIHCPITESLHTIKCMNCEQRPG